MVCQFMDGVQKQHSKTILPYHTAIRRSLNAFPTSPTRTLLAEAGLPSIEERVKETTWELIPHLFNTKNPVLYTCFRNVFGHKRRFKLMSTIRRCAAYSKNWVSRHKTVETK